MTTEETTGRSPSARETELLERAYEYVLTHGLSDLSLRPLASAIGSSPRVLLFLFGSKDGLVRRLLARARAEELALLAEPTAGAGLGRTALRVWEWLAEPGRPAVLRLWLEAYSRSLVDPSGPWQGFARDTVEDWLRLLAQTQPAAERATPEAVARRTAALAVLRGGLMDLLATGDAERVDTAVRRALAALEPSDATLHLT